MTLGVLVLDTTNTQISEFKAVQAATDDAGMMDGGTSPFDSGQDLLRLIPVGAATLLQIDPGGRGDNFGELARFQKIIAAHFIGNKFTPAFNPDTAAPIDETIIGIR